MVWQTFASVLIPGYTINMLVKASRFVVSRTTTLPVFAAAWLPTTVGLGSIPFIVKPIDHAVDAAMDVTIRRWLSVHEKRS
jgi:fission process protein 1